MKVVLIGTGKWGSKLKKVLDSNFELKKVFNSKKDFRKYDYSDINFVVIATPNHKHYSQARYLIKKKVNVFCEKPLTLNYNNSKSLIDLAKKNNKKLYINDIETYKEKRIKIKKLNYISRGKNNKYTFKDIIFAWAYHDFYLLKKYIDINNFKFNILENSSKVKNFIIKSKGRKFVFNYSVTKKIKHQINNQVFETKKNLLPMMFKKIFTGSVSKIYNQKRALWCNKLIDKIL